MPKRNYLNFEDIIDIGIEFPNSCCEKKHIVIQNCAEKRKHLYQQFIFSSYDKNKA